MAALGLQSVLHDLQVALLLGDLVLDFDDHGAVGAFFGLGLNV
jgi:hypothetical protein